MRALYLLYAAIAYAIFFATFLYFIAFVVNLPFGQPTIDFAREAPPGRTLLIDVALIALFGVQHSAMARPGFKAAWTRVVTAPIERSTYVLFASLALIILMLFWHEWATPVWTVTDPVGAAILWALFGLGWLIVLVSTFLINHFELFGLQQAWFALRERAAAPPVLRQPLFYRFVRHPLYAGRSEEHTSELQSLMRISYAVFCLKKTTHITPAHLVSPLLLTLTYYTLLPSQPIIT